MDTRARITGACFLFIAVLLMAAACSSTLIDDGSSTAHGLVPVASEELPPLPGLDGIREPSIVTQVPLDPQQPFSSGGKISTPGEDLLLDSNESGFAWAMYAYQSDANPLISLRLTFSYPNGPGAWVGFPNYETGRWDWKPKAVLTQQIYQVNTTPTRDYISPQGNLYCLVLSADDADVLITDLLLVADLPPPPTFSISGRVTNANFGGISGILIGLTPGGDETTTDGNGNYSFGDLEAGSYTITPQGAEHTFDPVSINAEITDSDLTDQDFIAEPVQMTVTYVDDIASLIDGDNGNEKSCLDCHSGQFPDADLDLSTYTAVRDNATEINFRVNLPETDDDFMPRFNPKWSQANLDLFQAWINGGLLEN